MNALSQILVVEDNAMLLLDLIDGLADHDIKALPATTADAAIPTLLSGRIDALITDIELPGALDGLQLARICAELRPDLPIVVVSAGIRPSRAELPREATFLPKPYRLEDVLGALSRYQHCQAA